MKKRIINVMLTFLIVLSCFTTIDVYAISKNTDEVYEISTSQDLVDFSNLVNSGQNKVNAKLTADIDMSGINLNPIGTYSDYEGVVGSNGLTAYRGTFDGNNYTISNLMINVDTKIETGLFSRAAGATIKNVRIKDANITNTAGVRAGIIAGELDSCVVQNCFTTGTVNVVGESQKGGIAGECYGSIISNCATSFSPFTSNSSTIKSISLSDVDKNLFLFDGSGTIDKPYLISSQENLFTLSNVINNQITNGFYRDAYYRQTCDIDLENKKFTPIGVYHVSGVGDTFSSNLVFNGAYDGDYHLITNVNINYNDYACGLFGRVGISGADSSNCIVKNLLVEGTVTNNGKDCPRDYTYTGGIIGNLGYGAKIESCSFKGSVSGTTYSGGLVGTFTQGGSMINCYANADVVADKNVGGLIGYLQLGLNNSSGSTDQIVRNSYFAGNLKGTTVGGICGVSEIGDVRKNTKIAYSDNYYLNTSSNGAVSEKNIDGCYEISSSELKQSADKIGDAFLNNSNSSYNKGYPIFKWELDISESNHPTVIPFNGKGTEENPYQISSIEDLFMLSEVTNDKSIAKYFLNCCYIQTDDINLNNAFFTPIGMSYEFVGEYNGNYHKITNLRINTSKNDVGLFSEISDFGKVYRLSIEGTVNTSGNNVGGIVGVLGDNSFVSECDYHGSVSGSNNVGSLIGLSENEVKIESCYSNAKITGTKATGGLIGNIQSNSKSVIISKSYFSGTINSNSSEQGAICGIVNDGKPDSSINIHNTYFLFSICNGNAINGDAVTGCTKLSETALKACADMIDSPFTLNNSNLYDGYPIFEWQSTPYSFKGNGTESNPYKISSKEDLINMCNLINSSYFNQFYGNAYYIQTANIDLKEESWIPIASEESGQVFNGSYNGSHHYINGLKVDSDFISAGLFGVIDNAKIFDIVVYGSIENPNSKSSGGIAGQAKNDSSIVRCAFIGDVSAESIAGGIVGNMINKSTISYCYHNGNISSDVYAGGITGNVIFEEDNSGEEVLIQNCYQANGVINGEKYSGCIAGNCETRVGLTNTIFILNCFSTTESDAITNNANATKDNTLIVTKSMLKKSAEDLGDYFIDNTSTQLNDGYPVFTWQIKSDIVGDVNNDGKFNISDVVMMQKWLLCTGQMTTWENGDLYKDDIINVFDLCLMKKNLIYA